MMPIRNKTIAGVVAVVVIALLGYGIWLLARDTGPTYRGLVTHIESDLDDSARAYFEGRLATTQAAVAAQEAAGDKVDLDNYLSIASDAYALGDLVTAREALEKQLDKNSLHPVALNNYAQLLSVMGDLQSAESAYQRTLEIDITYEKYYADYINFLQQHYPERTGDIKGLLEASVVNTGQNTWNMQALGKWYADAGDCDQMNAHYKVAISLDPNNQSIKDDLAALKKTCQQN